MNHSLCEMRPAILRAVLLSAVWPVAASGEYQFDVIVDNQEDFSFFNLQSAQAINDAGEVAFFATQYLFEGGGIYKGNGSSRTLISTNTDHFVASSFTGSINDNGKVVFSGAPAFQSALYTGNGGAITPILSSTNSDPNPRWMLPGAATINNVGAVAFWGARRNFPGQPPNTTVYGYHVVDGGVTTLLEEGAVYSGTAALPPAFNDAGQAAFTARSAADNSFHILRHDGAALTTIDTGFTAAQLLSINASGDVAFVNQDSTAVNVYRNGGIETAFSTADGFEHFSQGDALINDFDQMAFEAQVSEFEGNPVSWNGVFTGTDLVNDRVLMYGDPLLGRTITSLDLVGLNNAGQILMSVELSGPSVGFGPYKAIVVATAVNDPDFDQDDDVDGADFLAWQRGVGGANGTDVADGNANGDAFVDGSDLAIWEGQFGTAIVASMPIPEPGALALCALAALGVIARRRSAGFVLSPSTPARR